MGMGTMACWGHVLEATEENIRKLNIDVSEIEASIKEDGNSCSVLDYLEEDDWFLYANINGEKVPVDFYVHHDSDRYDQLEEGERYFIFDESDLYHKQLTDVGKWLSDNQALPEERAWTEFG